MITTEIQSLGLRFLYDALRACISFYLWKTASAPRIFFLQRSFYSKQRSIDRGRDAALAAYLDIMFAISAV